MKLNILNMFHVFLIYLYACDPVPPAAAVTTTTTTTITTTFILILMNQMNNPTHK